MSPLHLLEALVCLLPITDERMHKQRIDSSCLGTGGRGLDGVLLICLYDTHKTNDMSVIDLVDSNRLRAVLADNGGYLENIVIVHEINSAVVLDVDYLDIALIVGDRIDKRNCSERIFVAAALIEKSGLSKEEIRYSFAGDLLAQLIATSFGNINLEIPMFGLYGACSTMGEGLGLGAMCVEGGIWESEAVFGYMDGDWVRSGDRVLRGLPGEGSAACEDHGGDDGKNRGYGFS